jgi:hypothetical protein
VISGVDESGKSTVIADENTPVRLQTPGMTICDIWQVAKLPSGMQDDDATTGQVLLNPAETGWVYRVTTKEDVLNFVELRWRPDDHQAAVTASV